MTLWRLDCMHDLDGALALYFSDESSARATEKRLAAMGWMIDRYQEPVERYFAMQLRLGGPWPLVDAEQLYALINLQAAKEIVA